MPSLDIHALPCRVTQLQEAIDALVYLPDWHLIGIVECPQRLTLTVINQQVDCLVQIAYQQDGPGFTLQPLQEAPRTDRSAA